MKLLTYSYNGTEEAGVLSSDGKTVYSFFECGLPYISMIEFLENYTLSDFEKLESKTMSFTCAMGTSIEKITFCAPIPNPKRNVICIGLNFPKHVEESSKFAVTDYGKREKTVYFSKRVDRAVAHNGIIPSHMDITEQLDYEAELTVIIGKGGKNISSEKAFDHVFGYTIMNDVTAREIQKAHKQYFFGKSLDGFCPMGPWIVTKDEFENPPHLNIKSFINGELRQNGNTKDYIFDIAHVISEFSSGCTLYPGDIIMMGTPDGVGMGFEPPKWLKSGDAVECVVDGIGILKNIVE